jgi:hypothetical protein
MAEVSSHLRNFAVAEVIGFIALLDGHPKIIGAPTVQKARAAFQQAQGTAANPMTHAIPSDMLLNGDSLVNLYHTDEARRALQRAFGMGVMAPEDWENQAAFQHQPRENNIVDVIAERHRQGGGLVDAFRTAAEAAVAKGSWDGSGKRRHDLESSIRFITQVYSSTWVPHARAAYSAARSHFAAQLILARNSNPQRLNLLEHRREILETQIRVFEKETNISPEAAKNVWKFAAAETWK